jgi:hypothetical protein
LAEEEEEEKEDLCGDDEKEKKKKNCNNMHRRGTLRSRNTQKRGITNTKTAECTLRSQNLPLKRGSFTVTVIPQGIGRYVTRIK